MGNIIATQNTSFQTSIAMGGGGGGGKQEFAALFAQWTMKNWSEAGLLNVLGDTKQVLLGNTDLGGVAKWFGEARGNNPFVAKLMEMFAPKDEAWAASPNEMMKKAAENAANWVNNNKDAIINNDWHNPDAMAAAQHRDDMRRQGGGGFHGEYDPRFNMLNNANANADNGGNDGGANRAFPAVGAAVGPLLQGGGGIQGVPMEWLGRLSPSPSPGEGQRRSGGPDLP